MDERIASDPDAAFRRDRMVREQIAGRGVRTPQVLEAMHRVRREAFLPHSMAEFAYEDAPLPIDEDQTISQPYIVALMVEALALKPSDKVLEVGTGSGYAAAVLAEVAGEVFTVERFASLAQKAAVALQLRNLHGVHARVETLTTPFDVISCRAFASLPDFVTWSRSALAAPHGVWLAMKGKHPEDEIAALPADVGVFHVEQLVVPGLDAERCIVWMKPR